MRATQYTDGNSSAAASLDPAVGLGEGGEGGLAGPAAEVRSDAEESPAAADDEEDTREHFIPIRKSELLQLLCAEPGMTDAARSEFTQFYKLLAATFHFEYHDKLEQLKDDYSLFDPDADTKPMQKVTREHKKSKLKGLMSDFVWLLERANFRRLTREDIEVAMQEASDWGINLQVDFKAFDELEIFSRGDAVQTRVVPHPYMGVVNIPFKPRRKTVEVPVYQRLVILLRLKPGKHVPKGVDTDSVHVKVFKDIPKMDLEMLLPATRVNMSLFDRLKLGFSFSSALGMGGYKAAPLVGLAAGASMSTVAALGVAGGCVGYGVRSFMGYLNTKQRYQLTLTQSLYFLNLDNNAGVLFRLLDEAEEQECRETMLAYYFLWREPKEEGWTEKGLDKHIEEWIKQRAGLDVNMEIDDALGKLRRLKLLLEPTPGRFKAVPIDKALEVLDHAWDNHFAYNGVLNADGGESDGDEPLAESASVEAPTVAHPAQPAAHSARRATPPAARSEAPAARAAHGTTHAKPPRRTHAPRHARTAPATSTAAFHAATGRNAGPDGKRRS